MSCEPFWLVLGNKMKTKFRVRENYKNQNLRACFRTFPGFYQVSIYMYSFSAVNLELHASEFCSPSR